MKTRPKVEAIHWKLSAVMNDCSVGGMRNMRVVNGR